ncbi:Lung seven transmembrane receptor-like [Trema orientale]|uniref:Lung seven transmembrane receptor-like n=1 Tax=Trema orientale TaxID=63057 RepID=A0A2P5F0D1_TREOI|nr:Lung seven transmembrane receptor-like [Trema orientale]
MTAISKYGSITFLYMLLILTTLCSAEIRSMKIRDDGRSIIDLDDFGFNDRGRLELSVSGISFSHHPQKNNNNNNNSTPLDFSNVGFFLCVLNSSPPQYVDRRTRSKLGSDCPLKSRMDKIHNVQLISPSNLLSNNTLVYYNETHPGHYFFVFSNCIEGMNVSMDIQWSIYNVLDHGNNARNYLSVGHSAIPRVYLLFSLTHAMVAAVWIYLLYKKRPGVLRIHLFMLVVLIAKVLKLVYDSADMFYIKHNGRALGVVDHAFLLCLFKFVTFFQGITHFTILALINSGWLFLKPYLQLKDKTILIILFLFQIVATVIQAQIEIHGEYLRIRSNLKLLFYVTIPDPV